MKITIVGVGLLGGSLALQAKEKGVAKRIIGVDANPENADKALELGIVDEIATLEEAIPLTDLVVLATPVNVISSLLPRVLDALPDGKVVVDLGSTKEIICRAVENHPRRRQYVAAHPIAGTENSGPAAAFSGLLKRKTMILCDQEKSSNAALNLVVSLAQSLEMRLSFMNSVEHDRHLAYVSHLSHISSFALGVTVLEKEKGRKHDLRHGGQRFFVHGAPGQKLPRHVGADLHPEHRKHFAGPRRLHQAAATLQGGDRRPGRGPLPRNHAPGQRNPPRIAGH
jgi:prephenate dehydrogenase